MEKAQKTHLIIGAGEVGNALFNILSKYYPTQIRDKENDFKGSFNVIHVAYPAYPPVEHFIKTTRNYIKKYKPELVIIHSTVPVGTTKEIGEIAVHSPVRGMHTKRHHPGVTKANAYKTIKGDSELFAKSLKKFVKYFGGPKAREAAEYFKKAGVPVQVFKKAEAAELAKLLDTAYYGWNVVFAKEAKRIADQYGVDYEEVYSIPNAHYNEGYKKLGMHHVVRPVLKHIPGKIGGHCVVPNAYLLDTWITEILRERNKTYEE
jgi:UDP-N-acetyl-D-mannosaminuronate dehydrogenase